MNNTLRVNRLFARHRALQSIGAAVLTFALAGCGLFGGDKKIAPLTEIRDSAVTLRWSASAGAAKRYLFTPGLGDKVVYVAAHDGSIRQTAPTAAQIHRSVFRNGPRHSLQGPGRARLKE